MSNDKKRIRVFAGPNGSGKSLIFEAISHKYPVGIFVNADEIAKNLEKKGFINLADFGLQQVDEALFHSYREASTLVGKSKDLGLSVDLSLKDDILFDRSKKSHSYQAAFIAGFIRILLMKSGQNFSFETVMSHRSKLEMLKDARSAGYRIYLYYVATESPIINKKRVADRVEKGGHDVPADKIETRYYLSLENLARAVVQTNRAFIFDNSGERYKLIAEVEDGKKLTLHSEFIPKWVDNFLFDRLDIEIA